MNPSTYKFLTAQGLSQYDATMRAYMEQTYQKQGAQGGSGVNVFDVTLGYKPEEGDTYIESFETQPEQIWESVNQDGFCVLRATLVLNKNDYTKPENEDVFENVQGVVKEVLPVRPGIQGVPSDEAESQPSTIVGYFVLSNHYNNDVKHEMIFTSNSDGQSWHIELYNGGEDWEYDIYPDKASSSIIEISWKELKDLRDNGELVPGQEYCIMDYWCTTNQCKYHNSNLPDTGTAGHSFGIMVKADSYDTLNENARARKECWNNHGYFDNSKLEAWKLKYCIDNDTRRFPWADGGKITVNIAHKVKATMFYFDKITSKGTYKWVNSGYPSNPIYTTTKYPDSSTRLYSDSQCQYDWNYMGYPGSISNVYEEGTGVIYWMQDEWGNEAPYDFKNILFGGFYTFSSYDIAKGEYTDGSLTGVNFATNIIKVWTNNGIPRNIFYGFHNPNQMANCGGWWDNQLGEDCTDNAFGDKGSTNHCSGYGNRIGRGCAGISFDRNCSNNNIGNNVEKITFNNACQMNTIKDNCSDISFDPYTRYVTVYEGTNGSAILPTSNVDYKQFIGIPKGDTSKPILTTYGKGGSTGGGTEPLSVAVSLSKRGEFVSADHYFKDIRAAILKENRPVFMHVYSSADEILFLQLSKITDESVLFSSFFGGIYYECLITENQADCWFTQDPVITDILGAIDDLDTRVTALEGDTPDQYDVTLTYGGVEVPATVEVTGEEPIRASGLRWTVKIVECIDYPQLVGVELTGTGESIEDATFTGYDAAGEPISAVVYIEPEYPRYKIEIDDKDAGSIYNAIAELTNTVQDKTQRWLYYIDVVECKEAPTYVGESYILVNAKDDDIFHANYQDESRYIYVTDVVK